MVTREIAGDASDENDPSDSRTSGQCLRKRPDAFSAFPFCATSTGERMVEATIEGDRGRR
jgi:hypothetical protein